MIQPQKSRIRFMSRLGAVSLLSLGLVVAASVAPASAAPGTGPGSSAGSAAGSSPNGSAGGSYVALGDSYTSGQGVDPHPADICRRSASGSYPAITAASSSYREALNFACSGADTEDLVRQIGLIEDRVKLKASLVTLTVGVIDVGSNDVLAACAPDPTSDLCKFAVTTAGTNLSSVGPKLVTAYRTVAAAFPKARIVVLNYPLLFDPQFPSPLVPVVNESIAALNVVIAGAVQATGNPRVSLTDVTDEFDGHGIGTDDPYINFDADNLFDLAGFHPNALGNSAGYSAALRADRVVRGR